MLNDKYAQDKINVSLAEVDASNWREVMKIELEPDQHEFVAEPGYYLNLSHYDGVWNPLAIQVNHQVIGMMMWAVDPADGACWLGGLMIDRHNQGDGFGRGAMLVAIDKLSTEHGYKKFALSYARENQIARDLYFSIGFRETGEMEGEEIVARLMLE
jgi:diamine N-acetyltransferase